MHEPRQALVGRLALLSATVAAIFALALLAEPRAPAPIAPPAAPSASMPPTDADALLELIRERTPLVASRVATIRGIDFRRVPVPRISDIARLRELAERELDRPRIRRDLEIAEIELRLLGLLEPEAALADIATDAASAALAYYDPRTKRLYLVEGAVPGGAELAEFVLAHELTHALEDERFGLPRSVGVSDDRALAQTALVEGTASHLMSQYAARHLDPFALLTQASAIDADPGELPRFAEAEITFAYTAGARFVAALLALNDRWALVDHALAARLPATTEQIIHPEKFLSDERPLPVPAPGSPGSGWRAVDAGSLGEFGTRELIREGAPGLGADLAAAGWGGDRYRLFARASARACAGECRGTHALGVVWRGDTAAESRELHAGLRDYVRGALEPREEAGGSWRLSGGWATLTRRDDLVGLGVAPNRATSRRLAEPAA